MARARIGIIAGRGTLPIDVAEAALKAGREVHILGLEGEVEAGICRFPHTLVRLDKLGHLFRVLREKHCKEIVLIGGLSRPDLTQIRPDFKTVITLPFVLKLTFGGDDSLLSRIVVFFERQGFIVKGAHEIAPELLCPQGQLGKHAPRPADQRDLGKALQVVRKMGDLDIGQGAIVARSNVLAVEAAEGTDAMLARVAGLKQWGFRRRCGVLVKAPKPKQELRVDMPAIGPETIERAARAGLRGIGLAANQVLIAEREEVIRKANRLGLFLVGLKI